MPQLTLDDWQAGRVRGWTFYDCQEFAESYLAACGLRRFRSMPSLITPNLGYAVL